MQELTDMPNLGKKLADELIRVGITTPGDLIEAGAENAFIRLKTVDPNVCINHLYALEGAIQGIRWHDIDANRKKVLNRFFKLS